MTTAEDMHALVRARGERFERLVSGENLPAVSGEDLDRICKLFTCTGIFKVVPGKNFILRVIEARSAKYRIFIEKCRVLISRGDVSTKTAHDYLFLCRDYERNECLRTSIEGLSEPGVAVLMDRVQQRLLEWRASEADDDIPFLTKAAEE